MKKSFLFAKVGVVSTTVLAGLLICGTKIGLKEEVAINNFLGAKTFDKIESEDDANKDKEYFKPDHKSVKELKTESRAFAKKVEAEGLVMLKNDNNTLPLAEGSKVSLAGISSVFPANGGKGSAQNTKAEPATKPIDAFKNVGFDVNEELNKFYVDNQKAYRPTNNGEMKDAPWQAIVDAGLVNGIQSHGDAVFFTISRLGGEASDFPHDKANGVENGDYLKLGDNEKTVLKGLKQLKSENKIKKIIVLLNTANQIQTDFLYDDQYGVDACLWIGTTGLTGFEAVADVVKGTTNPSGHLPDTYYLNNKLNPVMANFGKFNYPNASSYELPTGKNGILGNYNTYLTYQEGIYVGYRYTETRYFDVVTKRANAGTFDYSKTISHPFGFGGSYTEFEYSNFVVEEKGDTFECSVDVKNIGKVAGKDAVQIYASKPYTAYDVENGIEKSAVDLVGFTKTPVIKSNETYKAKITVNKRDLRTYDANKAKTYIIEEGEYKFTAATDSHAATNNILSSLGYDTSKGMDKDGTAELVKKINLSEDFTTYSKSEVNEKVKVTNLFDHADINKYEGRGTNQVKYLSRNDWAGTFPTKPVELKMTEALAKDLVSQDDPTIIPEDKKTPYPKYGVDSGLQLITLREDENGNKIPFDAEIWNTFLDQLTWEETVNLVTNGNRMTVAIERLGKPVAEDRNGPCGLAEGFYSDGNHGLAERVNDPDKDTTPVFYPSVNIFAATFDHDIAKEYGKLLGNDAIWAGCAGFYGIGLNTHRSPYGGRTYEYWSEDPYLAGTLAAEQVIELQKRGCNAYIKHFALNDQEVQRSGISIWLNEQTFREIYLRPFEYAVVDGGAVNAMAAFNRIGATHAPGDKGLITDLLRGEWGMTGYVVTDMYTIGYKDYHYPQLLIAGTDIPDGTVQASELAPFKTNHGDFAQQMRLAAKRILYATCHSNAMNSLSASTILVPITPTWQVALFSVDAVIGVLWAASVGYTIYLVVKNKKQKQ